MTLNITYPDLQKEIADYLGWTRTAANWTTDKVAELDSIIQSGLRQFYWPVPMQAPSQPGGQPTVGDTVRWSFLSPHETLGTVQGVGDYVLPSDFNGNAISFLFDGTNSPPLTPISEQALRVLRSTNSQNGKPGYYATTPELTDGSAAQTWTVLLYPTPDAVYTLLYQYDVAGQPLSAANPYPYGPAAHSETILESCLAVAEERKNDASDLHRGRFQALLAASIKFDAGMEAQTVRDTWPVGETAKTELDLTYTDLMRHVGQYMGYGWDQYRWTADQKAVADDLVRAGLRQFLTPPPIGKDAYGYEWDFLNPITTLTTTAPYSTGTIGIASGIVTLSGAGAVFPVTADTWTLAIGGARYTVNTRDGNAQLTLDNLTVNQAAGSSYSLLPPPAYDLPTDCADITGPFTFEAGIGIFQRPIEHVSPLTVQVKLSEANWVRRPEMVAMRPKTPDGTTWTKYEVVFWPIPDAAYTLTYRYKINILALTAANMYPPGAAPHAETILESCLSAAERLKDGKPGVHSQRYMERLAASVSVDRKASSPDRLGYNEDRSDRPMQPWWFYNLGRWNTNPVTYNGVIY